MSNSRLKNKTSTTKNAKLHKLPTTANKLNFTLIESKRRTKKSKGAGNQRKVSANHKRFFDNFGLFFALRAKNLLERGKIRVNYQQTFSDKNGEPRPHSKNQITRAAQKQKAVKSVFCRQNGANCDFEAVFLPPKKRCCADKKRKAQNEQQNDVNFERFKGLGDESGRVEPN